MKLYNKRQRTLEWFRQLNDNEKDEVYQIYCLKYGRKFELSKEFLFKSSSKLEIAYDMYLERKIPGKIIFRTMVGSQAYGTNTENSDIDIKGVYIQNNDDIIGYKKYEPQIEISKDEVYYEIGRFLELLQKGNPTMIELLFSPEDCIITQTSEFNQMVIHKNDFLSQEVKNSFIGYAQSQIEKAKGTDKKMNWEKSKIERKEPLDMCYVILNGCQESFNVHGKIEVKQGILPLKEWLNLWCIIKKIVSSINWIIHKMFINYMCYDKIEVKQGTLPLKEWLNLWGYNQENCIFNKLDHSQDVYQLYVSDKLTKGLQSENGNTIRVDSTEKGSKPIATVIFNLNAYSIHCKKYKEYTEWLSKRNTSRYVDIENHGQQIDGKNMLHCVRLLRMGREILEGKGVITRRPDFQELIDIRKGKFNLEEILEMSKIEIEKIKTIESNLKEKVTDSFIHGLLLAIRKS